MHLIFRKSCRVCGSKALTPVINLGDQYLQGSFVKPGKEIPPMRKIPLSLVRCDPTKDEKPVAFCKWNIRCRLKFFTLPIGIAQEQIRP